MEKLIINNEIHAFLNFLNSSWSSLNEIYASEDLRYEICDWFQANWELLVEHPLSHKLKLPIRLVVYSEGADLYTDSSRVMFPFDLPSHEVRARVKAGSKCLLSSKKIITDHLYEFCEFVKRDGDWYEQSGPFDCVILEVSCDELLFHVSDVDFVLVEV